MTQIEAHRLHDLYASLTVSAVRKDDWLAATTYAAMAERITPFNVDLGDDDPNLTPEPSPEWEALATAVDGEPTSDEMPNVVDTWSDAPDPNRGDNALARFMGRDGTGKHRAAETT